MAQETAGALITMTDRAVDKAMALLREQGAEQPMLRVFVAGGGCSGYQYGMAIAERAEDSDLRIGQGDVTLLVDPESAPLLQGAEIDFIDDVMRSGFAISNPNAVSSCGCGQSFNTSEQTAGGNCC